MMRLRRAVRVSEQQPAVQLMAQGQSQRQVHHSVRLSIFVKLYSVNWMRKSICLPLISTIVVVIKLSHSELSVFCGLFYVFFKI